MVDRHQPVLLAEVLDWLELDKIGETAFMLDATLGDGGHAEACLRQSKELRLVGLDRDESALERSKVFLGDFCERVQTFHRNFSEAESVLNQLSLSSEAPFDRILLDLGVSSPQLDEASRGFSFKEDAPLDMRMDRSDERNAWHLVNQFSANELRKVLLRGGVGSESARFANAIVAGRPIETTKELARLISSETRPDKRAKVTKRHPATLVFQALRMEVNQELKSLRCFLESIPNLLAPRGRLLCISFHSLEDREVTKTFRRWSRSSDTLHKLPFRGTELSKSFGKLLTPHAITPGKAEAEKNPRSRSARLRVFGRY